MLNLHDFLETGSLIGSREDYQALAFLKIHPFICYFCCNITLKSGKSIREIFHAGWPKILEMQFRTKIFQDIPIPLSVALQISGKQHFYFLRTVTKFFSPCAYVF
jgi:hypothetical protein